MQEAPPPRPRPAPRRHSQRPPPRSRTAARDPPAGPGRFHPGNPYRPLLAPAYGTPRERTQSHPVRTGVPAQGYGPAWCTDEPARRSRQHHPAGIASPPIGGRPAGRTSVRTCRSASNAGRIPSTTARMSACHAARSSGENPGVAAQAAQEAAMCPLTARALHRPARGCAGASPQAQSGPLQRPGRASQPPLRSARGQRGSAPTGSRHPRPSGPSGPPAGHRCPRGH